MDDIKNKAHFLAKEGFAYDVKKSKDVLDKETIEIRDVLGKKNDTKINKMSDVFPQSKQGKDDLLS